MNQSNFEQWNDMVKKMQEPFKAIAELNVKTLQSITFLKPEEWVQMKKPEELLEKQISLALENGHKALNYMQQSFEIIEKAMMVATQETKKASTKKS